MAKIDGNQRCPCGSGKKYKRCCWPRDRTVHVHTGPVVSPHGYRFAESELDRLSNGVVDLDHEGRLDPESREPFYEDIRRLRGSLDGACC